MRSGRPSIGHRGGISGKTTTVAPSHRAPARRRPFANRVLVALLLVLGLLPLLSVSVGEISADAKSPASNTTQFAAGSYIIDMGAFVTVKPTGLQPYGILYKLLTVSHTPVSWIIKDGKPGGLAAPDTGLPAFSSQVADFSASVVPDGAGTTNTTPVQTKDYKLGAFIIPKAFITAQVDSFIAAFPNVIVDKAATDFSAPVFKTLEYWPKAVLDAQNGAIAQGFYTNAGIPNEVKAYSWKSPSQLNSCDDIYIMPHADPTWATHSYLKPFNNQGGYIWAGCHAVSVLENLVNPANSADRMNLLTTDGLVPFGGHVGGTPPYNYNNDGSDPLMQIGAPLDSATQNGSEQIYLPKLTSGWRPSATDVTWDATQADVPLKSPGDARVVTYGRGFGNPANGMVMYEAGHNINKGSIGDVPAQRAFFNFLLLGGIDRAPSTTVSIGAQQVLSGGSTTLTAQVTGGSPGYNYQWTSSCGGTFSPASGFSGTGSLSTTFTAPAVASAQSCAISVLITDQCGRTPFGSTSVQVVPSADLSITKTVNKSTVSVSGTLTYTLTVKNNGTGTAIAPTVTDVLPAGAEYVSATPTPGSVNGQTLTWTLPDLAANATSTLTVTARALTAGARLTNTATVTSTTADPNPNNNTATAVTQVLNAGISIEKIARPLIVGPGGGTVTFEFVVHNTGTDPLTNVTVTDNPACATISGPTGDLNGDGVLAAKFNGVETEIWRYTCTRNVTTSTGDVAQSSSGITTGVPALDGSIYTKQDVVQVTAKDPDNNTVTGVASTVVTISNPGIAVTKTLTPATQTPSPGDKATFTVTVSNTGNVPLVSVDTTDIWPGTCDTATLPTLAVGASYSMTCDATVPSGSSGMASNAFSARSYSGGTGWLAGSAWTEAGGEADGPTAGNVQVVDGSTTLNPVPYVGWSSPYLIDYGGNKVTLTRGVDLSGKTDAVLSFAYFRSNGFNAGNKPFSVQVSGNGTTWTSLTAIQPATPNASDTVWSTYQVSLPAGALTTTTYIRFGDTSNDLRNGHIYIDDIRVVSNQVNSVTATAKDEYGNPVTATATANVTPGTPTLAITKSTTPSYLRIGDTFNYTVTVTNTSATLFQNNINVTDTLPTGLTQNGTVTVARPNYWTTVATDDFGSGSTRSYSTGTGWAGSWTETAGDTNQDPTAGRIQVVTNQGNPAPSLFIAANKTDTRVHRSVNLAGASSAQLRFDCSRTSPNSFDDQVNFYVGGYLVYILNQNTSSAVCPTTAGSFATITVPLPPAVLAAAQPVTVELRANGDKQFWFDNFAVERGSSASTVTAGNPPNLTSAGGNNGSASNFALAPGASMTFTIPVKVEAAPADGLQFSNLAQATSDQQTSPVSASVTTPYLAPGYSISKVAIETWVNGSGNVTYRIELTNTGNVSLSNVTVSDPSCNSPPTYVFGDLNSDSKLQVGEIWRYQCTRTVTAPISTASPPSPVVVPNTASATMTDTISGTSVGTKTASAEVRVIHPAVTITPSPTSAVILSGGTVAYTYTVTNGGDIGLTGVNPTAANCSPLVYQSGDVNGDGILNVTETWSYTCTTGPITSNQTSQLVSVTGYDRIFGSTVTATQAVAVNVYVTPDLVITKSAADATSGQSGTSITVGPSNSVTYTYTVTSPSASPAVGLPLGSVQVVDDKCSPVTPKMSGGYVVGDVNLSNKLDPGETWVFQCVGGALSSTTTNHAYATGTYSEAGGGTVSSNQAQATVTVTRPELTLGKEANSETVRAGHDVTYTYSVTNTGATSFQLSGANSYLGAPADYVVDSNGAITGTTACSPIAGPFFPSDASHDVNGNGVLDPGDMLFYTCTTALAVDTTDAFELGTSVDALGTSYTAAPALAQVFVIDPTFTVTKSAETSLGGPGSDVPGVPGEPVTYTFDVTHTTAVRNDFHDGLESLALTITDPTCDQDPTYVSGDTGNNGLLDPGEVWVYTCTLSSLPNGSPTVNTVSVTGSVVIRDVESNGDPTNPDDGLGDITHTAQATVSPSTKTFTVTKQGLNCDVDQPVCVNNFPGTSFTVYPSDPTTGSPVGTPLTNSPTGSATFVSTELVIDNDYWLVETSAAPGFQLLAQPIKFYLGQNTLTLYAGSASPLITVEPQDYAITIVDVPATALPQTGGSGFLPYLGVGFLLIVAAGLGYARPGRWIGATAGRGG